MRSLLPVTCEPAIGSFGALAKFPDTFRSLASLPLRRKLWTAKIPRIVEGKHAAMMCA